MLDQAVRADLGPVATPGKRFKEEALLWKRSEGVLRRRGVGAKRNGLARRERSPAVQGMKVHRRLR